MRLVDQWRQLERSVPDDWGRVRLRLTLSDERTADQAASLLGPINPGRRGSVTRFEVARRGEGPSPTLVARLLGRLDAEGITGELELLSSEASEAAKPVLLKHTLAGAWIEALAGLPPDWSDVYAEVELVSTDWLEQGALLMAPLNPARATDKPVLRFRVARTFGYGASPEMVLRCLERLDEAGIRGELRVLRVLSGTEPVATQGPVWYVEGRAV